MSKGPVGLGWNCSIKMDKDFINTTIMVGQLKTKARIIVIII